MDDPPILRPINISPWYMAIAGVVISVSLVAYVVSGFKQSGAIESQAYGESVSTDQALTTLQATKTEKQKIDKWIATNKLNQFGDAPDAMYPGGTPLFNEATGVTMDRYVYIKQQHPDKPWLKK